MANRYHYPTAATLAAVLTLAGCSSQAPCLQYAQQTHTRTISMRGYGTVQVSEASLVCSVRAAESERLLEATP